LLFDLIPPIRRHRYAVALLLAAFILSGDGYGAGNARDRAGDMPSATASALVAITGAGPALPRGARALGPVPAATPLRIVVGLAPRRPDLLDAFLRARARPDSPLYRRTLTPARFADLFGPTPGDETAVAAYLRAHGLRIARAYPDRLLLDVTGTARDAAAAFGTPLVSYRGRDRRLYYANTAPPRLPAALAPLVSTVVGLRDDAALSYRGPRPLARVSTPRRSPSAPPRNTSLPPPPQGLLTPAQIQSAYNVTPVYSSVFTSTTGLSVTVPITGAGETIALYELSPFDPADIAAYDAAFGLTTPLPINVPVDGGADGTQGEPGATEAALDIELTQAIAPGARILVYSGAGPPLNSADNTSADDIYAHIVNDNRAQVISTSWGQCEDFQRQDNPPDLALLHALFAQATAQGMTVLAASGDNGMYACVKADGAADTTRRSVDYPASDPYVVAVGGTLLTLANNGGIVSEQGWPQSGGGVSAVFPRSAWQAGPGVRNAHSNGMRQVPDVAVGANNYAVWVGGGWQSSSGTSAGPPIWAGLLALANEHRLVAVGVAGTPAAAVSGFGDIHPQLYRWGAAPSAPPVFRDITMGWGNGLGRLGPGWDYDTGWGVPDAAALVRALGALAPSATPNTGPCDTVPPIVSVPVVTAPVGAPTATPPTLALPTVAPGARARHTAPAVLNTTLTVRAVPAQVPAGGLVLLEARGLAGPGQRVTFQWTSSPRTPLRILRGAEACGAVTALVRVPSSLSKGRALVVHLKATTQGYGPTRVGSSVFRVLPAPT